MPLILFRIKNLIIYSLVFYSFDRGNFHVKSIPIVLEIDNNRYIVITICHEMCNSFFFCFLIFFFLITFSMSSSISITYLFNSETGLLFLVSLRLVLLLSETVRTKFPPPLSCARGPQYTSLSVSHTVAENVNEIVQK